MFSIDDRCGECARQRATTEDFPYKERHVQYMQQVVRDYFAETVARFVIYHTIEDAPVYDAALKVASAMISELRIHAIANVVELFVQTLVFQTTPIFDSGCQVTYSQFGLAIHQNDHQARRRFIEWAQNEIAVVPNFHKRILFSDEAHFWLNGYVNKQNCRIWSEANPQVYVETPLHPEKLTVWCALWAGGILLQKR
ncbi:hypothetical protein TNCV_91241 [Trichonephila clavipes]|nr:hypothetical protein TNCV_91241 [Trichonephila clavipes]